jgi:ketosteroid isomerase-like protein
MPGFRDVDALDRLISDDLLFAGPDGRLATKAQDLDAYRSGVVRFVRHQPRALQLRRIRDDVALASLEADLVVNVGGKEHHGRFRYTRVWARETERWRVVGGQVSEIKTDLMPQQGV